MFTCSKTTLLSTTLLVSLTIAAASLAHATASPYVLPDQANITITGDVVSQTDDEFTIDYGQGLIIVEMDDWDFHNEASWINPGETVMVHGEIDADFYQVKTIEADSVYVYDRYTYYYASDIDEEDLVYTSYSPMPKTAPEGTSFSLSGIVTDIKATEFTLNTGYNKIQVETAYLSYNPLDDVGFQKIDEGDRVYVTGKLDRSFFDESEIEATSIITLSQDSLKKVKSKDET